jgi:predicted rRNA methylase YqxC with S4 and FtsJ domains
MEALTAIKNFIAGQSRWAVIGHIESPILGGEGNKEFLIAAHKN